MAKTVILLLTLALAGCVTEVDPTESIPTPMGQSFKVTTTPNEAFELVGDNFVRFQGDVMLLQVENEDDVNQFVFMDSDYVHISDNLLGFLTYRVDELERGGELSERILMWNLPYSLPDRGQQVAQMPVRYEATSNITFEGFPVDLTWQLERDAGMYTTITLDASAREAPFTFTAQPWSPEWALGDTMDWQVVKQKDDVQNPRHRTILNLIEAYEETNGAVPQNVDEESLQLEMILSGTQWPRNTYSGEAMKDAFTHGDFTWEYCNGNDATYIGWGFDARLVVEQFGNGCMNS